MNKKNIHYYNRKYFIDRDHIDLHMAESIKILLRKNKHKKILDVGCGTGKLIKYLNQSKYNAYGCDKSIQAVKFAKRINNKQYIYHASAEKLPFKNNSFDMVTAISIVEHLSKAQMSKFLHEAQRILVKNGILFIVTPNYATPIRWLQGKKWFGYSDPTHINFYDPKNLISLLKKFKFDDYQTIFPTKFSSNFDWDLPGFFQPLPKFIKTIILYLLISTPLCFIRNSFWLSARKK